MSQESLLGSYVTGQWPQGGAQWNWFCKFEVVYFLDHLTRSHIWQALPAFTSQIGMWFWKIEKSFMEEMEC